MRRLAVTEDQVTRKIDHAYRISSQIHDLEDKLDLLLADAGLLMAEMTRFRINTDMDANIGQRALSRLAELQSSVVDARMKACGTHADLKKIIETTADFPFTCPEKEKGEFKAASKLRIAS